ncbi:MAG TPA: acyltransferase family protein, partial [Dokdonella sp.]
ASRLPGARTADALFLAGVAAVATMLTLSHLNYETYWQGHWLLFVWHGVVGAAVALMLFAGAAGSRIARALFDNRPLRYLGLISFGVYLWHYPMLQWLSAAHVFDRIPGYRLPWTLPILLLLSCAVADVSYRLIERPLLRIGRGRSEHPNVTSEQVPAARTA